METATKQAFLANSSLDRCLSHVLRIAFTCKYLPALFLTTQDIYNKL